MSFRLRLQELVKMHAYPTSIKHDINFQKYVDGHALLNEKKLINHATDGQHKYVVLDLNRLGQFYSISILNRSRIEKTIKLNVRGITYLYSISDAVDTYDKHQRLINPIYLYNLFKDTVQPIEDVNPQFDDDELMIWYEW